MVSDALNVELTDEQKEGLNPYSDGRWFLMLETTTNKLFQILGLNPYSDGRWFLIEARNPY